MRFSIVKFFKVRSDAKKFAMDGKVHLVLLQETDRLKYFNLLAVSTENINALLIILSLWSFGVLFRLKSVCQDAGNTFSIE